MTFKNKGLFLLIFFLLQVAGLAQDTDYLITRNHDTLYGNVRIYVSLSDRCNITVGKGKDLREFGYREVLEWKNGRQTWMVNYYKNKKGKELYMLLFADIYGKMRLLSDPLLERMKSWAYIDGKFHALSPDNLEKIIWPAMLKNQAFAKRFGDVPPELVREWTRGSKIPLLENAIIYYNRH